MEKQDNAYFDGKLQKAVLKLISEEWYAYQLYMFSRLAVKNEEAETVDKLFNDISDDEINDHMAELIKWCRTYDYEVPCGETEFKKYAAKKISKQLADLKKNKDAAYYIDEAIKSEHEAIASYKAIIEYPEVSQFTDLQSLLWHIYYDEIEHLEKLNSAKIACEADVDLFIA